MEEALVDIDKINDKKITDMETNKELEFKDLHQSLKPGQLIYVIFFRRWGCKMCQMTALELNDLYLKLEKNYPDKIKFVGIGMEATKFDLFKETGYFKHKLYVNHGRTIYKALQFYRPGCLSAFGFCSKLTAKRFFQSDAEYKGKPLHNTVAGDHFQNGGSLLINSKGRVIYEYKDSYSGDRAPESEIMAAITNYLEKE